MYARIIKLYFFFWIHELIKSVFISIEYVQLHVFHLILIYIMYRITAILTSAENKFSATCIRWFLKKNMLLMSNTR